MDNIKNNEKLASICYLFGSIFNAAIGFVLIPLLMSNMSVSGYGAFSVLQLCGTIFSAVCYFGITSAFTRSYFDHQKETEKMKCLSTAFILVNIGGLSQVIIGIILSKSLSEFLFGSYDYYLLIIASLTSASFVFINFFFLTYFRLANRPKSFLGLSVFSAILNTTLTYVFLVVLDQGIHGVIYGGLISQCITYVILFVSIFPRFKVFSFDFKQAKIMLSYGFQIVLSSAAGLSIIWSDQFFINHFLDLHEVGIYSLSVKLAGVILFIFITPFFQVVNPIVLESLKHKNTKKLCQYYYDKYLYLGLASIIFTYYFAYVYFLFFKESEYVKALDYLPWLLLSLFLHGSINILSLGFSITRNMQPQSRVYMLMAFVNIILNSVLIPWLGVFGAVLSTILSYSILSIILYKISNNLYDMRLSHYNLIPCGILLSMFLASVYLMKDTLEIICSSIFMILFIFRWIIVIKKRNNGLIEGENR
ncbi:oligosaccharide flippase family protein [Vibrio penaeicida]|uniref:lipopolysaccharide biosynthesis protein n=1 Tax=Vibrio penaeicida TaxID=104609 RepID=UPI002737178E|nr:oligosaccharide flippase family protein [Vibrio penaeicida]MDP2573124.1 oligosaccharide flippase family protein [Vibrio penaeicida]